MKKTFVQLTYRHIIDCNAVSAFDKAIFDITWQEFLLKSQAYNPGNQLRTFSAIKKLDGRVNSLHYKTALAASGLMDSLKGINPYVVDLSGKNIVFEDYRFELQESSVDNKKLHFLAIYFISPEWEMKTAFGDNLVLSAATVAGDEMLQPTFMLKTEMNLFISGYKEIIPEPVMA